MSNKERLFEIMSRVDKTFKPVLNENFVNGENDNILDEDINSYAYIMKTFPGHAKNNNPINSPQYKWYINVLNFIQENNNEKLKADLIKFFQTNFLGLDYGNEEQKDINLINWWLSSEQQEFITDELNINP